MSDYGPYVIYALGPSGYLYALGRSGGTLSAVDTKKKTQ